MFTIDRCKVESDEDILYNRNVLDNLKIMAEDVDVPHIILYGPPGSGKNTMLKRYLHHLYQGDVYKTKETTYRVTSSSNKPHDEIVKQSLHHIEIEPKGTNFDRHLIQDIVKRYSMTIPLHIQGRVRPFKLVIIKNLDKLSDSVQFSLRRTLEMYSRHCRFICVTNSLSKIIEPLRSRCKCIAVPAPSSDDRLYYALRIIAREGLPISIERVIEMDKLSRGSIKNLIWLYNIYGTNIEILDYFDYLAQDTLFELKDFFTKLRVKYMRSWFTFENSKNILTQFKKLALKKYDIHIPLKIHGRKSGGIKNQLNGVYKLLQDFTDDTSYHLALHEVYKLILECKVNNIEKIRDYLFSITITNVKCNELVRDLMEIFLDSTKVSDNDKLRLCQIFAECQSSMVKSRRNIIHFDGLVISIMDLLKNKASC